MNTNKCPHRTTGTRGISRDESFFSFPWLENFEERREEAYLAASNIWTF